VPALKLLLDWEGIGRKAKVRTGLGNSTVRDRREASVNVIYGETRTPYRKPKGR